MNLRTLNFLAHEPERVWSPGFSRRRAPQPAKAGTPNFSPGSRLRAECFFRGLRSAATVALVAGLWLLAAPAWAASGTNSTGTSRSATATNAAPTRVDYSTFRVVAERNIFNANRTARGVPAPPRDTRRPARVDSFGLVGTMAAEKDFAVAFFDGSSAEYRKALKADASIAGWKLGTISLQGVKLSDGTNSFDLRVGMSLRREDEGEWKLANGTSFAASASGGSSGSRGSTTSSAGSPAASAASAAAAETLRKMMERRAKEEQ